MTEQVSSENSQDRDQQIIRALQDDARQSNVTIAKAVGLSEGAVRRRISRMVESGQLRFMALPEPEFMGRPIHAIVRIQAQPGAAEQLIEKLVEMPELSYVYHCTGEFDIAVVGYFRSNEHFRQCVTDQLSKTEGIQEVRPDMVLRVAKRPTGWMNDGKAE